MKIILLNVGIILCGFICLSSQQTRYTPDWNSLDTRPLPQWYDEAKIGIFLHWGVYSVPALGEWFWWYWKTPAGHNPGPGEFMQQNYPQNFTYGDFAKDFRAELFNPYQWAQIFQASGAKYVVLTSKHHEGFCMWPSKNSWNWNAMDVGPNKDLVGELAGAIRNTTSLKFGVYHSLLEWFNPLYLKDMANRWTTQNFTINKALPELYDLVNRYQPEVIWSDGDWWNYDNYWNATDFIAWLYNDSPVKDTVVINDRWGIGDRCKHGDFFTCSDNFNPGKLQPHKWENCMAMEGSWGYKRDANLAGIRTIESIIESVVETISCGGNVLINVGPTKDGIIVPIFEERLRQLGQWLSVNGEAIYSSKPWRDQKDLNNSNVWYTQNAPNVYATILQYPTGGKFSIGSPVVTSSTNVTLLGYPNAIKWFGTVGSAGLTIDISGINLPNLPCKWAWTFKLQNVQ